ncbi:MAG: flagellar hook-basal body complex protein [Holosporales bacterium]|jgi:flagellar hook-basal body protein|nr:flagellar hook-basal body complex protein [Holosporales bacterium]
MSLFGTLDVAVTGFRAQARKMGSISNNIANADTDGYKAHETRFQSRVMTEPTMPGRKSISGGVRPIDRVEVMAQGPLQVTERKGALAIDGSGFLPVKVDKDHGQIAGTRTGLFLPDRYGYLRDEKGNYLQAIKIEGTTSTDALLQRDLSPVRIEQSLAGSPTSVVTYALTLPVVSSDVDQAVRTNTTQVVDSSGNIHELRLKTEKILSKNGIDTFEAAIREGGVDTGVLDTRLDQGILAAMTNGEYGTIEELLGAENATTLSGYLAPNESGDEGDRNILNAIVDKAGGDSAQLDANMTTSLGALGRIIRVAGVKGLDEALKAAGITDSFDALLISKGHKSLTETLSGDVGADLREAINDRIQELGPLTIGGFLTSKGTNGRAFLGANSPNLGLNSGTTLDDINTALATDKPGKTLRQLFDEAGYTSEFDTYLRGEECQVPGGAELIFLAAEQGANSTDWLRSTNWIVSINSLDGASIKNFSTGRDKLEFQVSYLGQFIKTPPSDLYLNAIWNNGASPQRMFFDLPAQMGSGFAADLSADGNVKTEFVEWDISESGAIEAIYVDGTVRSDYRVQLINCADPNSATEKNGLFYVNKFSGDWRFNSSAEEGILTTGVLESSNVDLAQELAEMIKAQHAYAANTRVLSTVNQMLSELERVV